jgi:hypothetical protein
MARIASPSPKLPRSVCVTESRHWRSVLVRVTVLSPRKWGSVILVEYRSSRNFRIVVNTAFPVSSLQSISTNHSPNMSFHRVSLVSRSSRSSLLSWTAQSVPRVGPSAVNRRYASGGQGNATNQSASNTSQHQGESSEQLDMPKVS